MLPTYFLGARYLCLRPHVNTYHTLLYYCGLNAEALRVRLSEPAARKSERLAHASKVDCATSLGECLGELWGVKRSNWNSMNRYFFSPGARLIY